MTTLNLPVLNKLLTCDNLLIAGMGGGFDIFCGLPIYFQLQQNAKKIHLANLTFSNICFSPSANLDQIIRLSNTLVGVSADTENLKTYFPELYLTQWFREKFNQEIIIWCFKIKGVQSLWRDYKILVDYLAIDGILLIDGGVDSLARGDETSMGTLIEDSLSLAAVSQLANIPLRLVSCVGFGAERDITYTQILENISNLATKKGFLGSCSLLKQMEVYQWYKEAVLFVQNQENQDSSVINSSIISAVEGHYGDFHLTTKTKGSQLSISPLMAIYWFFDLESLVEQHLFLDKILLTETTADVFKVMKKYFQKRLKRSKDNINL